MEERLAVNHTFATALDTTIQNTRPRLRMVDWLVAVSKGKLYILFYIFSDCFIMCDDTRRMIKTETKFSAWLVGVYGKQETERVSEELHIYAVLWLLHKMLVSLTHGVLGDRFMPHQIIWSTSS
jgi:hypothetical protein